LKRVGMCRGTRSSNPSPSSRESANLWFWGPLSLRGAERVRRPTSRDVIRAPKSRTAHGGDSNKTSGRRTARISNGANKNARIAWALLTLISPVARALTKAHEGDIVDVRARRRGTSRSKCSKSATAAPAARPNRLTAVDHRSSR